ncbi:hypothetical protein BDV96DRAFT_650775 [Lophiotrema nucula]|uniref:Caspase domain-containing protein n=1 Tax=Lophiotrema nucula TaxID=690887 RepID=A0A6A5YUI6_9PLEO|nr:hypothetical protein BDV96DRAFT_650775 [Lophiotrema nucula]
MDLDPYPPGFPPPPPPPTEYLSIRVLILEWDRNDPELQVEWEIAELERIFKDIFDFDVRRVKMRSGNPEGDLSIAINTINAEDIRDPSLLIMFYTGHGVETWSSENARFEVILARDRNSPIHANWSSTVLTSYREAHGDVLLIFDCCFAGNLLHCLQDTAVPFFNGARNVQAIVAAKAQNYAWKAFEGALTRLLIEALQSLSRATFSPAELFARIDQSKMRSEPYHYVVKGKSDTRIGRLDPALANARDSQKYGEDIGYLEPEMKVLNDDIRNGAEASRSLARYTNSIM